MRTRQRAAHGAALFYVLTAATAGACPVAADLDGAGIRFISPQGEAVIHRRLDASRIQVDFVVDGAPEIGRSVLVHGAYLLWYGSLDATGTLEPGTAAYFARDEQPEDMPVPEPGLAWTTSYDFTSSTGSSDDAMVSGVEATLDTVRETAVISVGQPSEWVLGQCSYTALPVEISARSDDGAMYSERLQYLPELGTAVLVEYADTGGSFPYEYVDIAVAAP